MPRGHGRMDNNFEHIERRRRALFRRSIEQKNRQVASKEPQISAFILRNTDQRCIIFTLVALELDTYWKLVQGSEFRSYSQSQVAGVDDHETLSPPVIVFQVNLPEKQRTNFPESASLQNTSVCSSSGTHVMGRSRNRNKETKSLNDSSITSLTRCSEEDSSSSLCDSSGTVGSDVLVTETSPTAEKLQKRSSRKKGKKKTKQYKRKNVSIGLEDQREEITRCASIVESSVNSTPALLDEHISGNNLPQDTIFRRLSAEDTIRQKDIKANNDYVDSSTTMMSSISYRDELEDSETVASISQRCVFDNSTSDMNCKSSATCPERIPYIGVISESILPERKSNVNVNSLRSNVNNHSFNIALDQFDDPAMESFQDCWNGDASENCNDVKTRLTAKGRCGLSISSVVNPESTKDDPPFCRSAADSSVSDNVLINHCHACDPYLAEDGDGVRMGSIEIAEFSQACSSNNFHAASSVQRGWTTIKLASRTGKDNNHSVWKRVQKMDTEHCVNRKDAQAIPLQVDFLSKDTDTRSRHDGPKKNQRGKNGRYPCSYEMIDQTSKSYSYKIASTAVESSEINGKRKPTSSLKQVNHYSTKEIPNGSTVLSKSSKPQAQKDKLRILPESNEAKVDSSSGLSSPCSTDSQLLVIKPTENCDVFQSGQPQKNREYSDEASLSENMCIMSGRMTSAVTGNQTDPIAALDSHGHIPMEVHSNITDQKRWHQDLSRMDCTDDKHRNMQAECSHAEYHEPDNKFGTVLQKWVPVGGKETVVSSASPTDSIKPSLIYKSSPNKADTMHVDKETVRFHYGVPLARRETHCSNNSTAELNCLSLQTDKFTDGLRCDPCTAGVCVGMLECSSHLSNKVQCQEFSKSKSDLDKIVHAVNNVYSSQATAEAVNQVSGTPIAEIERFIRSTSPVICQWSRTRNCTTSFSEQLRTDSLCWHQNYGITLGSLWQWYEEPGCYGLEVKAEERYNSIRLHNEFLEFKAYFVPYLSSVQLFRRPGLSSASSQWETTVSHEVHKTAKTFSELASFPIFSKRFPQPYKESDASLLWSSSSLKVELDNQSVRLANSSDEDLIFEYFEHAQPPHRSPLLKKIKELVNGDKSSDSQIYGDPSKLECMKLCDLHPASWYSVAWYPIYRIPEGNFRSAFLTYHSLGHFIHQSASPSLADDVTHLVSPVVGLQSYNAKKECWFLPRTSKFKEVQGEELLSSNAPKLVEERLRTLEHTAAVMATATVIKGHQRCANNHPDYNHFFSRW